MTKDEAIKLAQEIKIDVSWIVREEWEMKILKELFETPWSKFLVFKGGTALRLVYNSPRFSEDLDFSLEKKISEKDFEQFCQKLVAKFSQMELSDFKSKFYTLLAEFKIKEDFLARRFSLKIEISQREVFPLVKSELKLISSPFSNLQTFGRVEEPKAIENDKVEVLKSRSRARDIFDLWFLSSLLREPMPKIAVKLDKRTIRQELKKLLPRQYHRVVKDFEEQYGL